MTQNTEATDKGNVPPPKGVDNRQVKCLKCGERFWLKDAHVCKTQQRYETFLANKQHLGARHGFEPVWMPDFLYDFQKQLLEWAILKGRAAIFADCGLGKTPMQLVWASNVVRKTNKPVLILTPIAVGHQTVREASKFDVYCRRSTDGTPYEITVANYERLHHFKADDFSGVVCDESSILKSYEGVTKAAVTEFLRKVPYRLLCTATAAPNDYIELGTSSEALGEMGFMDMLSRFFKKAEACSTRSDEFRSGKWRFRGHAATDFWRWVCSWARAIRKPSDFGFDDGPFRLPPLITNEHVIAARSNNPEFLFDMPALTLDEQRKERRRTIVERCEAAAELVRSTNKASVVWCQLNDEGELLSRLLKGYAEEVSGDDEDERKEEIFSAFESGEILGLITKSTIAGLGMNWQHCSRTVYFPSHSFEQWYQSIRRFWRFGQKQPVQVDVVCSEGERGVLSNLRRKSEAADKMFQMLVSLMMNELRINKLNTHTKEEETPSWLRTKK